MGQGTVLNSSWVCRKETETLPLLKEMEINNNKVVNKYSQQTAAIISEFEWSMLLLSVESR